MHLLMIVPPTFHRVIELHNWSWILVVRHPEISVGFDSLLLAPVDKPLDIGLIQVVILTVCLPETNDFASGSVKTYKELVLSEFLCFRCCRGCRGCRGGEVVQNPAE